MQITVRELALDSDGFPARPTEFPAPEQVLVARRGLGLMPVDGYVFGLFAVTRTASKFFDDDDLECEAWEVVHLPTGWIAMATNATFFDPLEAAHYAVALPVMVDLPWGSTDSKVFTESGAIRRAEIAMIACACGAEFFDCDDGRLLERVEVIDRISGLIDVAEQQERTDAVAAND